MLLVAQRKQTYYNVASVPRAAPATAPGSPRPPPGASPRSPAPWPQPAAPAPLLRRARGSFPSFPGRGLPAGRWGVCAGDGGGGGGGKFPSSLPLPPRAGRPLPTAAGPPPALTITEAAVAGCLRRSSPAARRAGARPPPPGPPLRSAPPPRPHLTGRAGPRRPRGSRFLSHRSSPDLWKPHTLDFLSPQLFIFLYFFFILFFFLVFLCEWGRRAGLELFARSPAGGRSCLT